MTTTTTTSFTCLCQQTSIPATQVKHAVMPIPSVLCHCNSCRHQSGALASMLCELNSRPHQAVLDNCVGYVSTENITRYFCGRCGSQMFLGKTDVGTGREVWLVWAGTLLRAADAARDGAMDSARVVVQCWVGDSVDGGLAGRMLEVAREKGEDKGERGTGLLRSVWEEGYQKPMMMLADLKALTERKKGSGGAGVGVGEKLLAKCLCGGLQFYVTRPDKERDYDEKVQFYVRQDRTKYLARFCTCRSCASATGNPLQPWTYVPPEHIVTVDGQAIDFGSVDGLKKLPGVNVYQNDGVNGTGAIRSFCATCGATAFYENINRPWVVDVAVGLLRSESGAMANDFLEWDYADVSHREECQTEEFLNSVVGG